jgi:hypothetical protein
MYPVVGRTIPRYSYVTLDEAMKRRLITVSEKDNEEVNKIIIRSKSSERVFIMDGEEIVGAKQNRILNTSIMIAPKQVAEVPVSCVEQGRWTKVSENFDTGGTQLFARARQSNTAHVNYNYEASPSAGAQSNQGKIWSDVAKKRESLSMPNASGAMHDAYVRYDKDINNYLKQFKTVPDQVGIVFAIDGEIVGADIFDQHSTLDKLFLKLVKSYALDAIEKVSKPTVKTPDKESVRQFLRLMFAKDASFKDYDSPGEGRDVRITSPKMNGASLVAGNRPVHISLFASEKDELLPVKMNNVSPASQRRHNR